MGNRLPIFCIEYIGYRSTYFLPALNFAHRARAAAAILFLAWQRLCLLGVSFREMSVNDHKWFSIMIFSHFSVRPITSRLGSPE